MSLSYRGSIIKQWWRIVSGGCVVLFMASAISSSAKLVGKHGAVATVNPYATDAAIDAFKKGGNAVDATVAGALMLGVVDGHNSGIGGGCFLLIRTAGGDTIAIDGREMAPAKATRDMFLRNGKADPELSQTGALAIGIPGSVAAYNYAVTHFGKLKFRDLLLRAADLAEKGFVIDSHYASRINETASDLRKFESARRIFLKRDGSPYSAGEILKQSDLAKSYRAIAEKGTDWFYKGGFAKRTEDWMKQNGGLITSEDFANYELKLREPVRTQYRDYEIIGFPPPSSGGVHVAQILQILEHFDLRKYPAYSADSIHLIAEAMKLAFADRAYWLGDPDFAKVPLGLTSKEYTAFLAKKISLDRALEVPGHGEADKFSTRFFGKHTTHFSAADDQGNWVACTATVNTSFGSKVVIPGTGIVMNNQMDDFSAQPGVPNFFGLIGAEANAVEPKKRPLSSMSPTIVLQHGKPILSLGAAGGPTIISQTVVNLINILDYGMDVDEALSSPRFHHQWKPDELRTEKLSDEVIAELKKRGHKLNVVGSMGAAQIVRGSENGFSAVSDPRLKGKAGGY